jgi:hypothetical protein
MDSGEIKLGRVNGASRKAVFALLVFVAGSRGIAQTTIPSQTGFVNTAPRILYMPGKRSIFREIVDPHSREHWVLLHDVVHPEGPGRLVPTKPEGEVRAFGSGGETSKETPAVLAPCIHVGDKVVVEEHTVAAEGYLEAVAMEPAATGSPLHVRLKIGGKVVRAVALAPGKAELALAMEAGR